MSEHYTSHYLAEILRDLYFEESTGILEVRNPERMFVRFHFERGMLYFADSEAEPERFPARLAEAEVFPPPTLSKLVKVSSDPIELASRLVEKKVVSRETLAPAVRALVERSMMRAFSWPSGSYRFEQIEATAGFFDPDVLFTFECILKGIGAMAHFDPLRDVLLQLQGTVRVSDRIFLPIEQLTLNPNHGYVLSRVDGTMRLDEIALLLPPGEGDEALQFLYGLAVLGILEFEPPLSEGAFSLRDVMQGHYESTARVKQESALIRETVERMRGQAPPEILGVGPEADLAAVKHAYEEARARLNRDRFSAPVQQKHKKDLGMIEKRLAEAFLRLQVERLEGARNVSSRDQVAEINTDSLMVRREMVKTEAQAAQEHNVRLAEKYFQKAKEYFQEKDYHNCIQFCRLAIKFHDGNAPHHLLMAEALGKNPNSRWQRMAERAYRTACDLDPWNAQYRVIMGNFYKERGMQIRAKKEYEKALEILPTHAEAKAALKACSRRR